MYDLLTPEDKIKLYVSLYPEDEKFITLIGLKCSKVVKSRIKNKIILITYKACQDFVDGKITKDELKIFADSAYVVACKARGEHSASYKAIYNAAMLKPNSAVQAVHATFYNTYGEGGTFFITKKIINELLPIEKFKMVILSEYRNFQIEQIIG